MRAIAMALRPRRTSCTLCGEGYMDEAKPLCGRCFALLSAASMQTCRHCGKSISDCVCNGVKDYALWWYNKPAVRRLIHSLKHSTDWTQVDFVAKMAVYAINAYKLSSRVDAVAAVPSRPSAVLAKGYGHAEIVGREIALKLGLPYIDALYRVDNKQQKLLSASQRKRDLKLRFKINADKCLSVDGTPYGRVLLIDDIITSGGTMACCSALLRKSGVKQVSHFTLAKAMKRK